MNKSRMSLQFENPRGPEAIKQTLQIKANSPNLNECG